MISKTLEFSKRTPCLFLGEVGIVIDDFWSLGGTQTYSFLLHKELQKIGTSSSIISLKGKTRHGVIGLEYKSNIVVLLNPLKLARTLKRFKKVIVVSGQVSIYTFHWLNGDDVIHRESNCPIFRMNQQSLVKRGIQFTLFFLMKKISHKLKIICPSSYVAKDFHGFKNVNVITNFIGRINGIRLRDAQDVENSAVIGYVGRGTYAKGFDRLVKISNEIKNIVFQHYGPKAAFCSNIINMGILNNKIEMYNRLDALILLSRTEGFPNVVNEAIQFGLPVIISEELSWLNQVPHVAKSIIFCGDVRSIIKFLTSGKRLKTNHLLVPKEIEVLNLQIITGIVQYMEEKNASKRTIK